MKNKVFNMEENAVSEIDERDYEETVHSMVVKAVETNDENALDILLNSGGDVNRTDKTGNTCLHAAAKFGHAHLCCFLLKCGAQVNSPNNACITPLFLASRANLQTVQVLIQLGANAALRNNLGEIPLHAASSSGLVDVIVELITSGSDVNLASWQGLTPLCQAINSGSRNAVKTLLQFGADANQLLLAPADLCSGGRSTKAEFEEEEEEEGEEQASCCHHHVRVRVSGEEGQYDSGPSRLFSTAITGSRRISERDSTNTVHRSVPGHLQYLVQQAVLHPRHQHPSQHPQSIHGSQRHESAPGRVPPATRLPTPGSHRAQASLLGAAFSQRDGVQRGLVVNCEARPSSSEDVSARLSHCVFSSLCSHVSPACSEFCFSHECTECKSDSKTKLSLSIAATCCSDSMPPFSETAACKLDPAQTHLFPEGLISCQSANADDTMEETSPEVTGKDKPAHLQHEQTCTTIFTGSQPSNIPRGTFRLGRSSGGTEFGRSLRLSKNQSVSAHSRQLCNKNAEMHENLDVSRTVRISQDGYCPPANEEEKLYKNAYQSNTCDSATPMQIAETCDPETSDSQVSSTSAFTPLPHSSAGINSTITGNSAVSDSNPLMHTAEDDEPSYEKSDAVQPKQFRGATFRPVNEDSDTSTCNRAIINSKANVQLKSRLPTEVEQTPSACVAKPSAANTPRRMTTSAVETATSNSPEVPKSKIHRPQTEQKGFTALHRAAQLGMESMCESLLESGAKVNARTTRGETPLHLAAKYSNTGGRGDTGGLIRLLIRSGADVDAVTSLEETALHLAALVGDALFASVLLSEGADVRRKDSAGNTPLHKACERIVSPEAQRVRTVRVLLSGGARPDEVNRHGLTPLHALLLHRDDNIDLDVVRVLVSYKADPNRLSGSGEHPLLLAVQNGLFALAGALVEKGSDPNVADEKVGKTPMHYACKAARAHLFKLLWAKGGDPCKLDARGFSPLRYAVESGSEATVRACIDTGASTHQHFNSDLTKLHFDSSNAPFLSELFESSSALSSPFLYAFSHAHTAILAMLYSSGCFSLVELDEVRTACELVNHDQLPETQRDAVLYVLEISQSLPSLQNLCRWEISHLIGCRAGRKMRVRALCLPTMLINFVLFTDDA